MESIVVAHYQGADGTMHNIVYAGAVHGGVWRTDDLVPDPTGKTSPQWTPLTDSEPSLAVSALALDPGDSSGKTLWVGTGPLSSAEGYNDVKTQAKGLLKTIDGGQTWTVLGQDLAFGRIVSVVPTKLKDPDQVVLVAGLDGMGVRRSTDGGQSFTTTLARFLATDLVADPNDDQRFWAAVPGFESLDGGKTFIAVPRSGIFVTNDGGQTWNDVDDGTLGISNSVNIKLAVGADTTSPGGPTTVLYAAVAAQDGFLSGVFQARISTAGMTNWARVGKPPPPPR
jgi:hypothetical protein